MISGLDLLVVGSRGHGGPTGLSLALQAHDLGARVRIVERRPDAFRPSRALIMHARTLEVLRPLGVVEALLAKADIAPSVRLHLGSRVVAAELTGLVRQVNPRVIVTDAALRPLVDEAGAPLPLEVLDTYWEEAKASERNANEKG